MEYIQNEILDNTLLICGKNESHSKYIELLFENKKRTGGDEIEQFYYDNKLNQYLIIYKNSQTLENVMNHESITYDNELFIPFRVDRTKFIIENLDEQLEKDILILYAENLIQDLQHFKCTVDYLCNNLFLVNCDKEIDFNKLKERFERHRTIKNKELTLHLVARLNLSEDVTYKHNEYKNLYFKPLNLSMSSRDSPTSSEGSNEISEINNDEGFIEIHSSSRRSNTTNNSLQTPVSFFVDANSHSRKQLLDRIKELEDKLKNFDHLKASLIKIKTLSQDCSTRIHENSTAANTNNASAFTAITNQNGSTSNIKRIKTIELINDDIDELRDSNNRQTAINSSTAAGGNRQRTRTFDHGIFTPLNTRPKPVDILSKPKAGILKENNQTKPKSQLITTYSSNTNASSSRRNFYDSFDSNPTTTKPQTENFSTRMANLIVRTDSYHGNSKPGLGRGMSFPELETNSILRGITPPSSNNNRQSPTIFYPLGRARFIPSGLESYKMSQKSKSPPPWALSSPSNSSTGDSPSPVIDSIRSFSPSPTRDAHYRNNRFLLNNSNHLFMSNVTGLNEDLINRFPIIKYKKPKNTFTSLTDLKIETSFTTLETITNEINDDNNESITCTICLESLEDNVDVRILSCFHQFHVNCIDKWLREKSVCPSCKMCLRKSLVNNDY